MLGTDPEFPIRSRSGRFVPAHKLFGDIAHKRQVSPGIVAFRDGFVVELNVPPTPTPVDLVRVVQRGIRAVNKAMPTAWSLCTSATIKIDLDDVRKGPEDVKYFGCNPSYCAYSGEMKRPDLCGETHPLRYAGAHMHFSAPPEELEGSYAWLKNKEAHMDFIRMMDYAVGLPLTRIFHSQGQYERRKYYGQAGEYRPQEYPDGSIGVEYRTPPPQLWNSAEIAVLAFTVGQEMFRNFNTLRKLWDPKCEADVRHAIDTGEGREDLDLWKLSGFTEGLVHKYEDNPVYKSFQLPFQMV